VVVDLGCSVVRASPWNTDVAPMEVGCAMATPKGDVSRVAAWESGVISDWGALESLLHLVFYGRAGSSFPGCGWRMGEEGGVVVLEPNPLATSRGQREKVTQLLMEQFNVTGVVFAEGPACALFAVGRTTGLVVDVGHSSTLVAAVVDGVVVPGVSARIAGLGGWLMEAVLAAVNPELGKGKAAKEAMAQVGCAAESRAAFDAERRGKGEQAAASVSLSGEGGEVGVGFERFLCGELVLRPALALEDSSGRLDEVRASRAARVALREERNAAQGEKVGGVVATLARALQDPGIGVEQRRAMAEGILVCGGAGGSIRGLAERIVSELVPLVPSDISPALAVAPVPEYMVESVLSHAAWTGAAILAKQAIPAGHGITRQEYDELGPPAVHSKNYS